MSDKHELRHNKWMHNVPFATKQLTITHIEHVVEQNMGNNNTGLLNMCAD